MNLAGADRRAHLHKLKGYKLYKQAKLRPEAKHSSLVSLCDTPNFSAKQFLLHSSD